MKVLHKVLIVSGIVIIGIGAFLLYQNNTKKVAVPKQTFSNVVEVKDFCPLKFSYDNKKIAKPILDPNKISSTTTSLKITASDVSKKPAFDLSCNDSALQSNPIKEYVLSSYDTNNAALGQKIAKTKDELKNMDHVEFYKRYVEYSNPFCITNKDLNNIPFLGEKIIKEYKTDFVQCEDKTKKTSVYYLLPKDNKKPLIAISSLAESLKNAISIDL